VIRPLSSGDNGFASHAGKEPTRVGCCAHGSDGTSRETDAFWPADAAEPADMSLTRVASASVITIANTAAIRVTATARGGWK
jgi:hypothetical protein